MTTMQIFFHQGLHTLRRIPAHLEISFWEFVTRWMSESRWVQKLLFNGFSLRAYFINNRRHVIRQGILWGASGWLAGFLLGLITV